MNEERKRDEEFSRANGDVQRPGDRQPMGAPPPLPQNIPVGVAPPDPMVVVSNFDTRPIGAYDFANTQTGLMGNGEVTSTLLLQWPIPDGYTAVLRSVEVEFNPPGLANLDALSVNGAFSMFLLRDGVVIPNNQKTIYGELTSYVFTTHQVYGFWETLGMQFVQGTFAIPLTLDIRVTATFKGTLIPSKSRPPNVEIASDPILVRIYNAKDAAQPVKG